MARTQQNAATVAERRAEVVGAAAALLAERDIDGISMRAIAAAIGQSRMTPYHYFQNKEKILGAVKAHAFRRLTDYLDEASSGIDIPIERLRAEMLAFVNFGIAEPNSYRLMFQTTSDPDADPPELIEETEHAFARALQTGQTAVDARVIGDDPVAAYHVIWAIVHGLISLHLSGQFVRGLTVDNVMMSAIDLFLQAANQGPIEGSLV